MDFFREIFKFFIAKEYSFTSKFIGVLVVIILLFFIDNLLGFSFYYSKNQKITQLKNIEELKKECSDNHQVLLILNQNEKEILNRKNVIEIFFNLFSQESFDVNNKKSIFTPDTVFIVKYDTIKYFENYEYFVWKYPKLDTLIKGTFRDTFQIENKLSDSIRIAKNDSSRMIESDHNGEVGKVIKSRSRVWHTLTSSYLLILLMIFLPFLPFSEKPFDWGMFVGMLIFSILIAGVVWLNQYLLSLVPVILNKPWINYILNVVIHACCFIIIGKLSEKKKKT